MKLKFSLKKKTFLMIIAFCALLIAVSIIIGGRVIVKTTEEQYLNRAEGISGAVSRVVDREAFKRLKALVKNKFDSIDNKVSSKYLGSDAFNKYTAQFSDIENDPDFIELRDFMRVIQNSTKVGCIYLTYVDAPTESVVYVVDAANEKACPPGCFDPLLESQKRVLTDKNYVFSAYITNTEEYGWLSTAGFPVYETEDNSGDVIGYAFVDISMNQIRTEQFQNVLRLFLWLLLATAVLAAVGIIVVNNLLIKPIKLMSDSAASYHDDEAVLHNKFAKLNIKTGDELQELSESMKKMEKDLNEHIAKLVAANSELDISKDETDKMKELASKDSLTGIRNKTAYDREVERLDKSINESYRTKFGIAMIDLNFLKHTNDTFGHDRGDTAIKDLCDVICSIFKHSPVFRIGGDEFAVVLEGKDYDNIAELTKRFNDEIKKIYNNDALKPWKRVSAALGYALYDRDHDRNVSEVFRRADKAMYEHKNKMKAGGVKPFDK